jgi:hypothetical protein
MQNFKKKQSKTQDIYTNLKNPRGQKFLDKRRAHVQVKKKGHMVALATLKTWCLHLFIFAIS